MKQYIVSCSAKNGSAVNIRATREEAEELAASLEMESWQVYEIELPNPPHPNPRPESPAPTE